MAKKKPFVRPPKKQKAVSAPETADEYQEAADREEEAGGKHRAGDPAKSARAFIRALEIYDKALIKHPRNFDLAYNKARLQFEITQQPALVEHIGVPLADLLQQTLESHRRALRLNEENPDVLFNTAQVLISLSEHLSESNQSFHALPLLQESLELLSSCLSRQEMLLEQQKVDFEGLDEGGVPLDPDEKAASTSESDASEQTALIETPITANDLLDTVHASLSALTTLTSIVEQSALQTYGDMAHSLTEQKAPAYVSLLPPDLQEAARLSLLVDRAIFVAAFADAQYSFYMIEMETYLQRLDTFQIKGKDDDANGLCQEAEARTEFAHSVFDRFDRSPDLPAETCWKQFTLAQDLYTKATKLTSSDAQERKPDIYESKGSLELLRHRLATSSTAHALSKSVRSSAATLISNAQTYFKGATQLARADGDAELESKAKLRWLIATDIGAVLYGVEPKEEDVFKGNSQQARERLAQALRDCVDEGLIGMELGEEVAKRVVL